METVQTWIEGNKHRWSGSSGMAELQELSNLDTLPAEVQTALDELGMWALNHNLASVFVAQGRLTEADLSALHQANKDQKAQLLLHLRQKLGMTLKDVEAIGCLNEALNWRKKPLEASPEREGYVQFWLHSFQRRTGLALELKANDQFEAAPSA